MSSQSSLETSLALSFQAEDGFELKWMLPDGSEQNCESTKSPKLKTAPKTLVFNLKRYVFSLETLEYTRCAGHFEFPRTIDLGPYMISGDSCEYTLSGVVIHEGSSGGGHYYSYIRDRHTNRWYKFDDSSVTPWDVDSSLSEDTFGGIKTSTWTTQFGEAKTWSVPKPAAYVLFYDKQVSDDEDEASEEPSSLEASPSEGSLSESGSLEQLKGVSGISEAYHAVMEQNASKRRASHVLNLAHIKIVLNLLRISLQKEGCEAALEGALVLALKFFFETVVRIGYRKWSSNNMHNTYTTQQASNHTAVKDKEDERKTPEEEAIEEQMHHWKLMLNKGFAQLPAARKFLQDLGIDALKRLLLDCPHDYSRKIVAALLLKGCDGTESKLQLFFKLMSLMSEVKAAHTAQYSSTLSFLLLDPHVRESARAKDVPAQIAHYMLGPKSPVPPNTVAARGWATRNYAISFNQDIFIKCFCALIEPLDTLPDTSREMIEGSTEVRALVFSGGSLDSIQTFVRTVCRNSEQRTLGLIQWLAHAPSDDVDKTANVLLTLLQGESSEDGSQEQLQRVEVALSALRREAQIACQACGVRGQQGAASNVSQYTSYSSVNTPARVKKLVQIITGLSSIPAVRAWTDRNIDFLLLLRQTMNELTEETRISNAGCTYTQGARLQRTRSTLDAEAALSQMIGHDDFEFPAASREPSSTQEFESLVDEIHELLQQEGGYGLYKNKRDWCSIAARQERDPEQAVKWILKNECSLSLNTVDYTASPSVTQRKRKTVNFQPHGPQALLSSDDEPC